MCGCLGVSSKAQLEETGWRTWGEPEPWAVAAGSSVESLIRHSRECRDGKIQAVGCCALIPPAQIPALSQSSSRSPNLPVLKTLPIKWDDNCALHNCRHGPGEAACCCCSAPRTAEPAPRAREIIRTLHINKNIITSLHRETMNSHCKPIMLSICSRKQESSKPLRQPLPLRKLRLCIVDRCLWEGSLLEF